MKDIFKKCLWNPAKSFIKNYSRLPQSWCHSWNRCWKIFQTLSQHQGLLDKTNTLLYSFQEKDTVETTIRQHAYDLYMMIPQSIINQITKHLVKEGKLAWDVATNITGQEFYSFFQTSIRVAHKHQHQGLLDKINTFLYQYVQFGGIQYIFGKCKHHTGNYQHQS